MTLTFRRGGATAEQIAQAEKLGIRYKKYQKRQLLAAAGIGPATEAQVQRLEQALGRLPADYRDFLLTENGGVPSSTRLGGGRSITLFFSLVDRSELNESLEHQWRQLGAPHWLPIAENAGGDKYLLGLSGDDAGTIHFFRHDAFADDPDARQRLAGSFHELLALLGGWSLP